MDKRNSEDLGARFSLSWICWRRLIGFVCREDIIDLLWIGDHFFTLGGYIGILPNYLSIISLLDWSLLEPNDLQ